MQARCISSGLATQCPQRWLRSVECSCWHDKPTARNRAMRWRGTGSCCCSGTRGSCAAKHQGWPLRNHVCAGRHATQLHSAQCSPPSCAPPPRALTSRASPAGLTAGAHRNMNMGRHRASLSRRVGCGERLTAGALERQHRVMYVKCSMLRECACERDGSGGSQPDLERPTYFYIGGVLNSSPPVAAQLASRLGCMHVRSLHSIARG